MQAICDSICEKESTMCIEEKERVSFLDFLLSFRWLLGRGRWVPHLWSWRFGPVGVGREAGGQAGLGRPPLLVGGLSPGSVARGARLWLACPSLALAASSGKWGEAPVGPPARARSC